MKPTLLKEERSGWPAQSRPDRELPEPWTIGLLVSINRVHHHALSPKGDQVAFVWEREGNSDLWLTGTDGGGWAQRLTFDRPVQNYWEDASPRWSPDGEWMVFASQGDTWSVPSVGGKARRLTDYQTGDSSPIFSPGGERIYYLSGRRVFNNLCYTTLDGDWPTPVTRFEADVSDPQPAPDGKRVAFVYKPQNDLNRSQICLVPAMGGDVQHLTGAAEVWDSFPRWLPDGRHIAFLSNRSGWQELYLFNIAKNDLQQLTALKADVREFAVHPGGARFALVVNNQGTGDL
jgi:Tol biopolymer transport system component